MSTRSAALVMVLTGLCLGVGANYYRAIDCGSESACDAHWATAYQSSAGAVAMGWAWLTQAPTDRPSRKAGTPKG